VVRTGTDVCIICGNVLPCEFVGFRVSIVVVCRSQWPRGLRRRSAVARLLRSWVRILPGAWIFVCCECCVLTGRGLCDELITRPEESYRLWCVVVCDLENLKNEEATTRVGSQRHSQKKKKKKKTLLWSPLFWDVTSPRHWIIGYRRFETTLVHPSRAAVYKEN